MTNHESSHRQDLLNKWHEICSWDVRVDWPSYKWSHPVSGFPFYVLCPQNRFQNLIFSAPCQTGSFPGGTSVKEPACQCRRCKRCGFNPWAGKIPWRRAQQPTSVFLPGEFHGQRSLVGYSALGQKSWAPLKWLSTHLCMSNRPCTLGQPGKGECWVCFSCQMFLLHAADFHFVLFLTAISYLCLPFRCCCLTAILDSLF